jgi:hypothetical protein
MSSMAGGAGSGAVLAAAGGEGHSDALTLVDRIGMRRRVRATALAALLACLVAAVLATLPSVTAPGMRTAGRRLTHPDTLLPGALAPAASAGIGAADSSFWATRAGISLVTKGGGVQGSFTRSGAELRVREGSAVFSLAGVGSGAETSRAEGVAPTATRNAVRYRDGATSERYRNGPYGLEQSFTVAHAPRPGAGELVLTQRLGGSLTPEQVGSQLVFRTRAGTTALRYSQLHALGAGGRALPASMRLRGDVLQLRVNVRGARFPVRIDPFIQQGGKLSPDEGEVESNFGTSVALSADGNTAVIGASVACLCGSGVGPYIGAAWVFARSGSTWTQQAELKGSGESGTEVGFGESVAISADGDTVLVGAPEEEHYKGSAWVFARSGETWTQQGAKLTVSDERGDIFGASVALSADGDTALIGAPDAGGEVGGAWVFTRSGESWSQSAALAGTEEREYFGRSVALAADGATALVGGPGAGGGAGAALAFTRSGEAWSQQGRLAASGSAGLGAAVALSADAGTALVGAPRSNDDVGAAWVFTRAGEAWSQSAELKGTEASGEAGFGQSVALSGEGNVALVGGPEDDHEVGAAWAFAASEGTWTQQGEKLTVHGVPRGGRLGESVALSAEGSTGLLGAPDEVEEGEERVELGAAYPLVFANAPTVVTGSASAVGNTSATLSATVDPNGFAVSECYFQYGAGAKDVYSSRASCTSLPGSGTSAVPVSAPLSDLSEGTTYHYRIVAVGPAGTSVGRELTFATGPVEYGQCLGGQKKGNYSEGNCQTVAEKKGKADHKGKFEFRAGPAASCVAVKKGFYSESQCRTRDVKGGKPKGKYEKAAGPGFTATTGAVTLETPGLGENVVCAAGSATGEVTGLKTGVERLTLTGCEAAGRRCTSEGSDSTPSGKAGVIVTNLLDASLSEPAAGEVLTNLTSGEHQPYLVEFGCEGPLYRTAGTLGGVQSGDIDVSSLTSATTFSAGHGEQALYSELSETEGTSWGGPDATSVQATAANTAASAVEIKT